MSVKLDETVCRGSLIMHRDESLVVLGPGVHIKTVTPYYGKDTQQRFGWRVMSTSQFEAEAIQVSVMRTVDKEEEVDAFFPGNVYPLPDYIK